MPLSPLNATLFSLPPVTASTLALPSSQRTPSDLIPSLPPISAMDDQALPTPTRFLQECIDFRFTPGLVTRYVSGDINIFDKSFEAGNNNDNKKDFTKETANSGVQSGEPPAQIAPAAQPEMDPFRPAARTQFTKYSYASDNQDVPSSPQISPIDSPSPSQLPKVHIDSEDGDYGKTFDGTSQYDPSGRQATDATDFTTLPPFGSSSLPDPWASNSQRRNSAVSMASSAMSDYGDMTGFGESGMSDSGAGQSQDAGRGSASPKTSSAPRGTKRKEMDESSSGKSRNDDEDAKRRRILERNRLAASRCRQKKKLWMQELEVKSATMAAENRQIQSLVEQLKEEVLMLKNQLFLHRNCGCNVIQGYIATSNQYAEAPPSHHHDSDVSNMNAMQPMGAHMHAGMASSY